MGILHLERQFSYENVAQLIQNMVHVLIWDELFHDALPCLIQYGLQNTYYCGIYVISIRADSRCAPSQWETPLLCNKVSHWLGASLKSALSIIHTDIDTNIHPHNQYLINIYIKIQTSLSQFDIDIYENDNMPWSLINILIMHPLKQKCHFHAIFTTGRVTTSGVTTFLF